MKRLAKGGSSYGRAGFRPSGIDGMNFKMRVLLADVCVESIQWGNDLDTERQSGLVAVQNFV
ncbi:hypothetical protein K3725_08465 [Leisingera sp. S132]|uniref:hypothetical protein n=1 Tax=Leisingera sp. S132 TaxID=2867016 RepID=UPI0021A2EB1D|nr:hypothetical protein [Leisingera sp. S132]UWQ81013.1 hypothetical protein K3725_08465 [Leisingera sp. S132]